MTARAPASVIERHAPAYLLADLAPPPVLAQPVANPPVPVTHTHPSVTEPYERAILLVRDLRSSLNQNSAEAYGRFTWWNWATAPEVRRSTGRAALLAAAAWQPDVAVVLGAAVASGFGARICAWLSHASAQKADFIHEADLAPTLEAFSSASTEDQALTRWWLSSALARMPGVAPQTRVHFFNALFSNGSIPRAAILADFVDGVRDSGQAQLGTLHEVLRAASPAERKTIGKLLVEHVVRIPRLGIGREVARLARLAAEGGTDPAWDNTSRA